jgi:hypothetical protein
VQRELEEERRAHEAAEAERRRLHELELHARLAVNDRLRAQIEELKARVATQAASLSVPIPVPVPVPEPVAEVRAARAPWILMIAANLLAATLLVLLFTRPAPVVHRVKVEKIDVVPVPIPVALATPAPAPRETPAAPAPATSAPKSTSSSSSSTTKPYHYGHVDLSACKDSINPLCGEKSVTP